MHPQHHACLPMQIKLLLCSLPLLVTAWLSVYTYQTLQVNPVIHTLANVSEQVNSAILASHPLVIPTTVAIPEPQPYAQFTLQNPSNSSVVEIGGSVTLLGIDTNPVSYNSMPFSGGDLQFSGGDLKINGAVSNTQGITLTCTSVNSVNEFTNIKIQFVSASIETNAYLLNCYSPGLENYTNAGYSNTIEFTFYYKLLVPIQTTTFTQFIRANSQTELMEGYVNLNMFNFEAAPVACDIDYNLKFYPGRHATLPHIGTTQELECKLKKKLGHLQSTTIIVKNKYHYIQNEAYRLECRWRYYDDNQDLAWENVVGHTLTIFDEDSRKAATI